VSCSPSNPHQLNSFLVSLHSDRVLGENGGRPKRKSSRRQTLLPASFSRSRKHTMNISKSVTSNGHSDVKRYIQAFRHTSKLGTQVQKRGPLPYTHISANGHVSNAPHSEYKKKISHQSAPHLDPTAALSVAIANHASPALARGHASNIPHARTTSQDAALFASTAPTGAS
jgi:hypothetical protein